MEQRNKAKLARLEHEAKQQADLCRYAYESGFIAGCRMAERAERIDWDNLKHCPYLNPEQSEAWCEGYVAAFADAGKLHYRLSETASSNDVCLISSETPLSSVIG